MSYDDDEDDFANGADMIEQSKPTGDGITVQINQYAMERIEAAAAAGVRQELSARIDKLIQGEIAEVVAEKLQEVVGKLAEEVILAYLTKPRPRTNAYGEQVSGTPMTIADQIPQKVESFLAEKLNARGERADHYDKAGMTRLEFLLNKQVRDELTIATKDAANKVTEEAKKVVAAHVGRFVAEQMIPQIEVGRPFP
jgi:hypothetical protein